jgi:hemolysin III
MAPITTTEPTPATAPAKPAYAPTFGEELAHAITHGFGAALSLVGFVVLVVAARAHQTTAHLVGCGVYGMSLILLYSASTVFHAVPAHMTRTKWFFQRCDHAAIYLLIAGTYTPFTLLALDDNPWGIRVFAVVWVLAGLGLAITAASLRHPQTAASIKTYERRSLALYLGMGWLGIIIIKPLAQTLPMTSIALLVAGGVAYTVGVAFFVSRRKWAHSIWHGFVMAGSGLHFLAVFSFV